MLECPTRGLRAILRHDSCKQVVGTCKNLEWLLEAHTHTLGKERSMCRGCGTNHCDCTHDLLDALASDIKRDGGVVVSVDYANGMLYIVIADSPFWICADCLLVT